MKYNSRSRSAPPTGTTSRWMRSLYSLPAPSVILSVATILGLGLRLSAIAAHDFPLNDGGLFYTMVQDLLSNGLHIPPYTSYNSAQIPFVYPPLGLYIAAILTKAGIPTIQVFRFVPSLVSAASVLAGYKLALRILGERLPAAFSAMVLGIVLASYDWRIMGGGITRSFGFLFGLLTLTSVCELLQSPSPRSVALTSIFGTLTVLSHPEAAVHTALGVLVLCAFGIRRRAQLPFLLTAGVSVVLFSAVWWVPTLSLHGVGPWLGAARSRDWIPAYVLLFRMLSDLDPLTIVFCLFGLLLGPRRPIQFLVAYALMMFIVLPRSAPQFAMVPVAMAFGLGAKTAVERLFPQREAGDQSPPIKPWTRRSAWTLTVLLLFMFLPNWAATVTSPVLRGLSPGERAAMRWAQDSTEPNSAFLVVEGVEFYAAMNAEWFPALGRRVSATGVQGYEWLQGVDIGSQIASFHALQKCGHQGSECVDVWARENSIQFDYVYVVTRAEGPAGSQPCCERLAASILRSSQYAVAFRDPDVTVFRRLR